LREIKGAGRGNITDLFARNVSIGREPAPGQKITIYDRAGAIGANVVAKPASDGVCNIRFRNDRFSTLESA
jgi:hypothetical protein